MDPASTTGDERWDAIGAFVEREQRGLLEFAYSLAGAEQQALDLVQDAIVRTAGAWARVRDPGSYCRRCIVNGFVSTSRRRRREQLVAAVPDVAASTFDLPFDSVLLAALTALPAKHQAVLVCRYLHDQSDAQIAELLNCPEATVRSYARRGLHRLRETWAPIAKAVAHD